MQLFFYNKNTSMEHPLHLFRFCPKCGNETFVVKDEKAKHCLNCGFIYYFNPSAAVACFIKNAKGELLVVRRKKEPAKGTLDLPGGFVDLHETAEQSAIREVKEETALNVTNIRYLFSIPNIYPYSGFDVQTVDLFFECEIESFDGAVADDDAEEILIIGLQELNIEEFGFYSIRQALSRYKAKY